MASRAEEPTGHESAATTTIVGAVFARSSVSRPRLGAAVRASFTDYYFNSLRLVPANVVWGAGLVAIVLVGLVWPLGGLLLLPLLALPTAGIFRLAARIVRVAPDAGWVDITWPYRDRRVTGPTLAIGVAVVATTLILGTNVLTGIGQAQPAGWALATLAGWGLVAVWSAALVAWPLVVDPARDGLPVLAKLRLAGALLLVEPVRIGGLGIAVAITTTISTVLTAALLTISIAFVALVACRVVYPSADRLDPLRVGDRP